MLVVLSNIVHLDGMNLKRNVMRLGQYFLGSFCILGMILSSSVSADTVKFTGKGNAVVIGADKLSATQVAYQAALKKAVEKAMRHFIHKGTKDEINFNLKKAELLKGPFSFVKKERQVVNKQDDGFLTIELEISVDMEELKGLLGRKGILASQIQQKKKEAFPSVMVLLTEELNGQINPAPFSAHVIRERLLTHQFEVVDEKIVEKGVKHDQAVQAVLKGDLSGAQAVALQYGSGMVIIGKAVVQPSGMESGGMKIYGAQINIEAVKADTGQVIASASAQSSVPHINAMIGSQSAVEEAAKRAGGELISAIEKGWEQTSETISVTISQITFAQLAVLKQILKRDFPYISDIKERSFNSSIAKLDLHVDAGIHQLADDIALKDFGTFRLHVLNFSPGKLDLDLVMNP